MDHDVLVWIIYQSFTKLLPGYVIYSYIKNKIDERNERKYEEWKERYQLRGAPKQRSTQNRNPKKSAPRNDGYYEEYYY